VIIYTSTVIRESKNRQTGFIYKIDWKQKKVLKKVPVPNPMFSELGERGGRRGGRGICFWKDEVVVANYDSLIFYDEALNFKRRISHPLFCALHEICSSQEGIWVTSTGNEGLYLLDPKTGNLLYEWFATEENILTKRPLEVPKHIIDRSKDYRSTLISGQDTLTHLNCVSVYDDAVYVTLSRQSAIVQLRPELKIIVYCPSMENPHNGLRLNGGKFIINDTWNQCVRLFSDDGIEVKNIDLKKFHIKILRQTSRLKGLLKVAKPGWLRGLAVIDDKRILAGTSPASIVQIDVEAEKMIGYMQLSKDIRHSIHGLEILKT